ncbi:hypothetical protein LCGC14_1271780 [marine sediment metagenome]|uniref:Uncharacterized protein n=1 Tax=marine sediment metagenome TaxID=412755 RepID=A0A0F9LIZ1_9ZZZZ
MGCKSIATLSLRNFSLDKMYDEDYSLQQIRHIFNQLDKNWRTLDQKHATLLEDIYDYLEESYYNCWVCGVYFEDHAFTDPNQTRHECYGCFSDLFS